jgi:hypothetical protein
MNSTSKRKYDNFNNLTIRISIQKQKEKWNLSKQSSSIVEQINQSRLIYSINSSKKSQKHFNYERKKIKKEKKQQKNTYQWRNKFQKHDLQHRKTSKNNRNPEKQIS